MLKQFRQLAARYISQHLDVVGPGFTLFDANNNRIGHVDRQHLRGSRIWLSGWAIADQIELVQGAHRAVTRPGIHRQDVAARLGFRPDVGFEFDQIAAPDPLGLFVFVNGKKLPFSVPTIARSRIWKAKLLLAAKLLFQIVAVSPSILRYVLKPDPAERSRIKTALGLGQTPKAKAMEARLFSNDPDNRLAQNRIRKITIIIPVFNAFNLLPEVLERVISHTDLRFRLILIEDCSTDRQVRPFLRNWVAKHSDVAELFENEVNIGFIGSVNRAFVRAVEIGDHVVLLNSDAFVPQGWASRLLRPFLNHENIASVTPMSNDAEILSVPVICKRTYLLPGQGEAIDAIARRFHPEALLSVAPTGVGFCMAINIAYLRRIPLLDTAFGRGYGEEVDWCQKARAIGGRHLALPGLFVEHRGGESFGTAEKLRLVANNNRTISARYPDYDREVQDFIKTDPLNTARVALALGFAASSGKGPVPVYLAHSLGGGADKYLIRRIAEDVKSGQTPVVLRVGGVLRWQVEIHSKAGVVSGQTDDFTFVHGLLEAVGDRRVIYSCGVGDPDPTGLPDYLLKLKGTNGRLEVLFHDYFPINPSYCLLDADGSYLGLPKPDGENLPLSRWQQVWGRLLDAADTLVVFSHDSRRQVLAAYPKMESKLKLRPHSLLAAIPRLKLPGPGAPCVVGVLGNINHAKGADVVAKLARRFEKEPDISGVLIGNIDPAYSLPASFPVHGDYQIRDIAGLVARYRISCWLVPSIWPETFSYTTHEALATGLPVFCFDLGAQGDAAAAAANGYVIPLQPDADLSLNVVTKLKAIGQQPGRAESK